jgi:hypothetical protein
MKRPRIKPLKKWHYAAILLGLIILCQSCRNDEGDTEFDTLTPVEKQE